MRESIWEKLSAADRCTLTCFWSAPGTKVVGLLKAFGLDFRIARLPDSLSGYLLYDPTSKAPSKFTVVVNQRHPVTRQRFTVAHELGHFLLHRRDDVFLVGSQTSRAGFDTYLLDEESVEEQQADAFAAGLLMPMEQFEKAVISEKLSAKELANRFWVSEAAARRRCDDVWRRRM